MLRLIGLLYPSSQAPTWEDGFFLSHERLFPDSRKGGNRLFHGSSDLAKPLFGNLLDRHRIHEETIHDRR